MVAIFIFTRVSLLHSRLKPVPPCSKISGPTVCAVPYGQVLVSTRTVLVLRHVSTPRQHRVRNVDALLITHAHADTILGPRTRNPLLLSSSSLLSLQALECP